MPDLSMNNKSHHSSYTIVLAPEKTNSTTPSHLGQHTMFPGPKRPQSWVHIFWSNLDESVLLFLFQVRSSKFIFQTKKFNSFEIFSPQRLSRDLPTNSGGYYYPKATTAIFEENFQKFPTGSWTNVFCWEHKAVNKQGRNCGKHSIRQFSKIDLGCLIFLRGTLLACTPKKKLFVQYLSKIHLEKSFGRQLPTEKA